VASDAEEEERKRREAEELESFKRRSEWSRLHYGVSPDEADERTRAAREQATAPPPEPDAEDD
jgi:hypothetical protein